MAEKAGLEQSSYSRAEAVGRTGWKAERALAEFFGVTLDQLRGRMPLLRPSRRL